MILNETDPNVVLEQEKKLLRIDSNPLERNHMKYMLKMDPEYLALLNNEAGVEVQPEILYFSNSLFNGFTIEEII